MARLVEPTCAYRNAPPLQYYLTIDCLWKTIQLDAHDVTARSTIVHWAIFLEEWQLATALLDHDRHKLPVCASKGFEELMTCYRLTVQMNAGTAQEQVLQGCVTVT